MLWQALYEYGKAHPEVVMPIGYADAKIDYTVNLGVDGSLLGVEKLCSMFLRPYYKITSAPVAEPLADKACISVGMEPVRSMRGLDEKRRSFQSYLLDCSKSVLAVSHVYQMVTDDRMLDDICLMLGDAGCGPDNVVGFRFDGVPLHDLEGIQDWWRGVYERDICELSSKELLDIVTGESCHPVMTLGKGLKPPILPDAQTSGAVPVSFNASAFESYGLRQNENAAMSLETNSYVMDALYALCMKSFQKGLRLGNIRFIHWYAGKKDDPEDDLLEDVLFGFGSDDSEDDSDSELDETAAEAAADRLVRFPLDGVAPVKLDGYEYHILLIAAQGARVAVLDYSRGDYASLYDRLRLWQDDFSMVSWDGKSLLPYKPVSKMMWHLLSASEQHAKTYDKKFAGVKPYWSGIMQSCISNKMFPQAVLSRAVNRFVSDLLQARESDDNSNKKKVYRLNYQCAAWIKAYLMRYERLHGKAVSLMAGLNKEHPNPAYHCGRIMAVYAEIQGSVKNVNAGVVERFYTSCMQSPALVFGQLQGLANHWLENLKYYNKKQILTDELYEAYDRIGAYIPKNLSMEDRGYFTLGFVQEKAELTRLFAELRKAGTEEPDLDEEED